jgi:hypothetical protein
MSQFGDSGSDFHFQLIAGRNQFFGGRLSIFEPMTEAAICDGLRLAVMGCDGL